MTSWSSLKCSWPELRYILTFNKRAMGNNGSRFVKKITSPFTNSVDCSCTDHPQSIVQSKFPVIVISRKGSMFFDEDGDLAHEFYVEVPPSRKGCKATMKKVLHNLIPQGEVAHQFPRLHVDFPIILHQVWGSDLNLCDMCHNNFTILCSVNKHGKSTGLQNTIIYVKCMFLYFSLLNTPCLAMR